MTAYHAEASDTDGKEILTWEGFGRASRELAESVARSGFRPDVIVSVARGGLIVGGGLAYALGVKLADAMNVEFYTDVAETLPDPVLLAPLLDIDSIAGRRVLVADDVADSGRTLQLVMDILLAHGAEVRTAVLYTKPTSIYRVDFAWKTTADWIVFPWSALPPVGSASTTDAGAGSR
ncbi:MAG TPA: phosphoribosyltransferase [Micropruina sp.]|nr:phosphoribosyltransferase [Micropruina sp.]HMR21073.1 phosphoribosyltransferase [Micropruina sp.]